MIPVVQRDGHDAEIEPRPLPPEKQPPVFRTRAAALAFIAHGGHQRVWMQRCMVRVTFMTAAANSRGGKGGAAKGGAWFAHGRYLARESATGSNSGFTDGPDPISVPAALKRWHVAGDELFWKLIISPENTAGLDLEKHVRDVMKAVESDLGTKLEWAAVVHRNTEHPHVHVVLRGVRDDGTVLKLKPEYIKTEIRARAEQAATNQLGYRYEPDVILAQEREISKHRFTGLDYKLLIRSEEFGQSLRVFLDPADEPRGLRAVTEAHLQLRCKTLAAIGLAQFADGAWLIDPAFQKSLRAMADTADRQRMLAAHGVMPSRPDLPFRVVRIKDIQHIEGTVLIHKENERTGSTFMLIETDHGEVLQVPHVRELTEARKSGQFSAGERIIITRAGGPKERRFSIHDPAKPRQQDNSQRI